MLFTSALYVPTLAIRPSEMRGLEYLPLATKERMVPCVLLAPWVNAHSINNAIERFQTAYESGPYFLDIDRDYTYPNPEASAQIELKQLSDPADAFASWCNFIGEHSRIIPCLQLRDQSEVEIRCQIEKYRKYKRTFALRIFHQCEPINLGQVIGALKAEGTADFTIILEGGWSQDALGLHRWFSGIIDDMLTDIDAQVPIVVSCTTIPKVFRNCIGRSKVTFTNHELVQQLQKKRNDRKIIYGDWAGTRPRERSGGSGSEIPPRIDYPLKDAWWVYRNPDAQWTFQTAAKQLVSDAEIWDGRTGQWGEQMISETAVSEHLGINTPHKNTAVRVNLHLHRQAFYGIDSLPMEGFEEDWKD